MRIYLLLSRHELAGLVFTLLLLVGGFNKPVLGQNVFYVDTWLDDSDAAPGDGICATSASECTLRAAIEEANAFPNAGSLDVISFQQIPLLSGFAVILMQGPYEITAPVRIDGTTASGEVILDGTDVPAGGIELSSDGSTMKGLTLVNFLESTALYVSGDDNVIEKNFIGLTRDGTEMPNKSGIFITGANNRVGGVNGVSSFFDLGQGNVIGSNLAFGIGVANDNNVIRRNFIGVDLSGRNKGNGSFGIFCLQSTGNSLGGVSTAHGNRIGFNGDGGIFLHTCENTVVRNNFVGTNHDGLDLGNDGAGITLFFNANGNTIGGNQNRGNVIGFNETGILLQQSGENLIKGNFIGVNREGEPVGNEQAGIHEGSGFRSPAYQIDGNVIGYASGDDILLGAEKGNQIAFNGGPGVLIEYAFPVEDAIRGNSIYENGGLGIDLEDDGQTVNDATDSDSGANQLQNHPEIIRAFYRPGSDAIAIEFTVSSEEANAVYPLVIDAYIADDAGSGEGEIFIGSVSYETSGTTGFFEIPADDITWNLDDVIVLTATDAAGNSSEFSPASTELSDPDGGPSAAMPFVPGDLSESTVLLSQPYPNPFNPMTTFTLSVPDPTHVRITVHDVLGRQVAELHDGAVPAGITHTYVFDGTRLASGTYLLRIAGQEFIETRRLMLLK